MKVKWHQVGVDSPSDKEKVEIVGYWAPCCHLDVETFITIREGVYEVYTDTEIYKSEEGYFLLPLYWRTLEETK